MLFDFEAKHLHATARQAHLRLQGPQNHLQLQSISTLWGLGVEGDGGKRNVFGYQGVRE